MVVVFENAGGGICRVKCVCISPSLSTYYYYYDYYYVSGLGADKENADNARDTIV